MDLQLIEQVESIRPEDRPFFHCSSTRICNSATMTTPVVLQCTTEVSRAAPISARSLLVLKHCCWFSSWGAVFPYCTATFRSSNNHSFKYQWRWARRWSQWCHWHQNGWDMRMTLKASFLSEETFLQRILSSQVLFKSTHFHWSAFHN